MERAPFDLERLSFTNSDIPVLKNASFSRLGQALKVVVVSNCELAEIEDKAFQGLNHLHWLDLSKNKIGVLKGVWFEDAPEVEYLNLEYNLISHVEDSFFTTVPNPRLLDLSNNQLSCLSITSISNPRAHRAIELANNPLSWRCAADIMDWGSEHGILYIGMGGLEVTQNITKNCIAQSPGPEPDDNYINTCVQTTLNELLPAEPNYTIAQLCEFWKDKPSSGYLNCTQ